MVFKTGYNVPPYPQEQKKPGLDRVKSERSARVTPGHLFSGAYYFESSKPTHLRYFQPLIFSCCDPYFVAAGASNSVDPFAAGIRNVKLTCNEAKVIKTCFFPYLKDQ